MAVGFTIPLYLLIIVCYGWWIFNTVIFDDIFDQEDILQAYYLALIFVLHVEVLRTIHTRVGYDESVFYPRNHWIFALHFIFLLPFIFMDIPYFRGFTFYMSKLWRNYWFISIILKAIVLASVIVVYPFYIDIGDVYEPIGHTYFSA